MGDKQFAWMQNTKPHGAQDFGSVGLRVLSGTMSLTLGLSVATLNSEADARAALDSMAALAQEFIDRAAQYPPTVAAAPPNSRTPDDLVALLNGVKGPNGTKVDMAAASTLTAEPPRVSPGPSPASRPACSYSSASYQSPVGSVVGQGMIQYKSKMDLVELAAVSLPATAAPPYLFDTQAAALRTCPTIQEDMGGGWRPWSAIKRLNTNIAADSSYAVAYQLGDGTGQWHLLIAARKGTLIAEARTSRASAPELQPAAAELAGLVAQLLVKTGA